MEPSRGAARPTATTTRRVVRLAVLLLVLSVLGGCGGGLPFGIGRGGNALGAELLVFANPGAGSVDRVAVGIESAAAASAFAGWFAKRHPEMADDLRARMTAARPGEKRDLLAFAGLGCAENGARLRRHDNNLTVEFTGGKGVECVAASQLVAVFAVKPASLPDDLRLQGHLPPRLVGPARDNVYNSIDGGDSAVPDAGDLRDPAVLERFVDGRNANTVEALHHAVDAAKADDRVFGAVIRGCRGMTAELVITTTTLRAATHEVTPERTCVPVSFIVAFTVGSEFIPAGAELRN